MRPIRLNIYDTEQFIIYNSPLQIKNLRLAGLGSRESYTGGFVWFVFIYFLFSSYSNTGILQIKTCTLQV